MIDDDLESIFQSAYKASHSNEAAPLKVKNDILLNMNRQHVTLLILSDLSAAFNTINHDIRIDCLKYDLRIELAWLKSPLSGLSQRVRYLPASPCSLEYLRGHALAHCYSQSTLGSYLKLLEITTPMYTQLYLSFDPNSIANLGAALRAMTDNISDIRS